MQKAKIKQLWLGICGLILFFLLWVSQTVRSTQVSYQIQKLENEMRKEQSTEADLMMKRDEYLSLESIEASAKELGLIAPQEENIIVIPLPER